MKGDIPVYTKMRDEYFYPASVSINKHNVIGEAHVAVSSDPITDAVWVKIDVPVEKLIDLAKEVLKSNGVVSDQPAMAHFLALMEALEIPNPDWWLAQHPGMLKLVGKYIAKQAKEVYDAEQNK